jgi:hypothetical protein
MANPTESCCPYRHHVVPTQLFTVRNDFPYACPLSNPCIYEPFPDGRQVFLACAHCHENIRKRLVNDSEISLTQVNTLTSSDFGIKMKFLCNFGYDGETLRGDLTSSDTRDDTV